MSRLSPVLAAGRTTAAARLCLRFRLGPIRRLLERNTDATTCTAATGGNPRTTRPTTSTCIDTSAPGLWLSPPSSALAAAASSWLGPSAATGAAAAAPAGLSRTLLAAHEKASGIYATAYSNLL